MHHRPINRLFRKQAPVGDLYGHSINKKPLNAFANHHISSTSWAKVSSAPNGRDSLARISHQKKTNMPYQLFIFTPDHPPGATEWLQLLAPSTHYWLYPAKKSPPRSMVDTSHRDASRFAGSQRQYAPSSVAPTCSGALLKPTESRLANQTLVRRASFSCSAPNTSPQEAFTPHKDDLIDEPSRRRS